MLPAAGLVDTALCEGGKNVGEYAERCEAPGPRPMARRPARTAATTEAQPFTPQAHGISAGADVLSRVRTSGKGSPHGEGQGHDHHRRQLDAVGGLGR
jgi:hypothetical protein